MSDHIPEELIVQILSRLAPKSLLRLRCVSKSWNSLISSTEFIRVHTQQTILSKPPSQTIIRYFSIDQKMEFYSIQFNNTSFSIDTVIRSPFYDNIMRRYYRIVGSCKSILCLSDDLFGYTNDLVLWNPSINRCLHLPMPPPECNQKGRPFSVFGFGFDTKSKDYKVVKMTYVQSRYTCLVPPKVEIFALSRGSWKQFDGFIPEICIMEQLYKQAVVQGKIHWIGYKIDRERKKVKNLILAFDLSDEIFVELQLPDRMVIGPPIEMNTAEFGESLAIYHYNSHPWTWTCSIWVMKEYGVVESWNKEFNVPLDPKPGMVLGFRNEGEILLTSSTGQLMSYNPRTQENIDFGIIGTNNSFFMGSYEESLILLNEGEPLIPNDFSSETDQDECKENDIDKENAQISGLWTQLAIRHYHTAVLDARNI